MIKFTQAEELRAMLPEEMSAADMRVLVNFAKHVRGRCRNNSAFNNFMNDTFGKEFIFDQVPIPGKTFTGLRITKRATQEIDNGEEES